MSALTLGLAQDWKREQPGRLKRAITSVWPAYAIESAATRHNDPNGERVSDLRKAVSICFITLVVAPFFSSSTFVAWVPRCTSQIRSRVARFALLTSRLTKQTVFSDAILAIRATPPETVNGLLTTDEDFLRD